MRLLHAVLAFSIVASGNALAAGIAPGPILAAAPSQYATTDGVRVHYKVIGHGHPVLVFLHGLGGDMNVWREQVAAFQGRAHLILIDLPGHGGSDAPRVYSMRGFARAVTSVLSKTRADSAIIVGHSLGIVVARELDRYYPGRSRAIISVDGLLHNPFSDNAEAKAFVSRFEGTEGDERLGEFFDGLLTTASPALRDEVRGAALATNRAAVVATLAAAFDIDAWDNDHLSVPLLAIVARSPQTNDAFVAAIHGLGRDVSVELVDGTDHFLMLDAPAELNARMQKWLMAHKWLK